VIRELVSIGNLSLVPEGSGVRQDEVVASSTRDASGCLSFPPSKISSSVSTSFSSTLSDAPSTPTQVSALPAHSTSKNDAWSLNENNSSIQSQPVAYQAPAAPWSSSGFSFEQMLGNVSRAPLNTDGTTLGSPSVEYMRTTQTDSIDMWADAPSNFE
jgi:hypothetical protein